MFVEFKINSKLNQLFLSSAKKTEFGELKLASSSKLSSSLCQVLVILIAFRLNSNSLYHV